MNYKNKKGLVLPAVLIFGAIVGFFTLITYQFTGQKVEINAHMQGRTQAYYGAKAGIEYALFKMRNRDTSTKIVSDFSGDFDTSCTQSIDLEAPFSGDTSSTQQRKIINVAIVEDGTTADGVRPKYRITSTVTYKD